jgi:hypothetical protein
LKAAHDKAIYRQPKSRNVSHSGKQIRGWNFFADTGTVDDGGFGGG